MTWEARLLEMFDDLEQQAEGLFAAERDLEVAERARAEYAEVHLSSRLMAAVDAEVGLRVTGVGELAGRLARVADGWCLLESAGQEWIVRTGAVTVARGLPARAVPPQAWPVTARLGFGSALRGVAESADECRVRLLDGTSYDVRPVRVGGDFVEGLAGDSRQPVLVAFTAIAAVHGPAS